MFHVLPCYAGKFDDDFSFPPSAPVIRLALYKTKLGTDELKSEVGPIWVTKMRDLYIFPRNLRFSLVASTSDTVKTVSRDKQNQFVFFEKKIKNIKNNV